MIDKLKSDQFGILLDTGHCNVNGENFEEVLPLCKGLPLHIHIDDNLGDADAHLIPGKGTVDFQSLGRGLRYIDYRGFISAELGASYIMDPTGACRETLSILREIFAA